MMELLTEQQKLILKERAKGLSNADIARNLNVSPAHVSQTFKNIREKITTVDDTIELLKETGYMDDTVSLQITDKTLERLKSLPMPKLKQVKLKEKRKASRHQNIGHLVTLDYLLNFVRIEIPNDQYSHPLPNYYRPVIHENELLIMNSVS